MKEIKAWWPRKPEPGNFGDILTPILLNGLFGHNVTFQPKPFTNPTVFGAGSIITHADEKCVVWGSGLMSIGGKLHPDARYLAVRGPRTLERLKANKIISKDIPMGDPAILMTELYYPQNVTQTYDYGIFGHYVDTDLINKWYGSSARNVLVINPLHSNPEIVIKRVMRCKRIISSSLHGVIIANAYGIPAVWVKHSNKLNGDGTKFYDYYESLNCMDVECLDFQERIDPSEFEKFRYILPEGMDEQRIGLKAAWEQYIGKE